MKTNLLAIFGLLTITTSVAMAEPITPPIEVRRPAQQPGDMHLEMHSSARHQAKPETTVQEEPATTTVLPTFQSNQIDQLHIEAKNNFYAPFGPAWRTATYGQPQTGEPVNGPYYP